MTVCVMSGDITQRGEIAVLDKWNRAKIAADQGLDLVLELPFLYACSPASTFGAAAVDILALSGADCIAFGCEAEEPEKLTELARLQVEETGRIEELARREMKAGISYVKARGNATREIIGEELTGLSLAPNNILALEYLKRIMYWEERGRKIEPVPIIRKGSGYKEAGEKFAGGSAIREMIRAGWDVSEFIPYELGGYCPGWIDIDAAGEEILKQLKGIVLRTDTEELAKIRFVGEGIENRLVKEIAEASGYKDLLKRMTSRRYTTSTIRRMLINILLGVTKEVADTEPDPADLYGRILALGEKGRSLVASEPGLPFVANVNRTEVLGEAAARSLEMDIRAADLFNLLTGRDIDRHSDHRQKPHVG